MAPDELHRLLIRVRSGTLDIDAALQALRGVGRTERTVAAAGVSVDVDRAERCGFPEVVYAQGKTAESVLAAFQVLSDRGQNALATRVNSQQARAVTSQFPAAVYNPIANTVRLALKEEPSRGRVVVITAGTSDRPVAEEALETLIWMNCGRDFIEDVGVAGPHRLPEHLHRLQQADAVVVVAGMEGALPSVVGGWVPCPVIAVPTSVGYGASLHGIAALLGMLNSCASNVTVVNIDAGFRAAYVAGLIARRTHAAVSD